MSKTRSIDPLHGVTLKAMVEHLADRYGWHGLGERIEIRCFTHEPSVQSSLKFLRRTLLRHRHTHTVIIAPLRAKLAS